MGFEFHEGWGEGLDDATSPITQTQVQDYTKDWEKLGYNRLDAVSTGVMNESLTGMVLREGYEWVEDKFTTLDDRNTKDEEYDFFSEEWQEKFNSLTPDGQRLFQQFGAQNDFYAEVAFQSAKKSDLDQEYLASLGMEGTGYRLLGALTDIPAVLAIAPETGGASVAGYTARVSRILNSTFATRVLTGATIEGLMEVGRQNLSKEQRDEYDLILAVGLGGIARGLFSKHPDHELARVSRELLADAGKGLDVTAKLAKFKADAEASGGAANHIVEKLQYDLASQSAESSSQTFREFADKMYYQRTGSGGLNREEGKIAAEESKDLLEQSMYNMVTTAVRPLMTDIAHMAKRGVFKTLRAHWDPRFQSTINEVMGDLQLGKLFDPNSTPDNLMDGAVRRLIKDLGLTQEQARGVAKRMLKVTEDISEGSHDILRRAGSEMFQEVDGKFGIPKSKDYMPINHDSFKVADLLKTHGAKEMEKFFSKSINKALKARGMKLNNAKTRAVSKALLTRMAKTDEMSFITKMEKEDIAALLNDAGIDDETVDYVSTLLGKSSEKGSDGLGLSKHEKTRGIFDYSVKHTTKDGATISFKDIISNNFENSWFPYARTQAGHNTLEKLGLKTDKARKKHRAKIKEELRIANKEGEISSEAMENELIRYDETILELEGKPLTKYPLGKGAQALRIVKNMNIARYLGQTFWTMSAELGSTTWNAGIIHMLKSVPMMGQIRKQFLTGKLDDDLMQELYTHMGFMGDVNRGIGFSKYEHDFANISSGGSKRIWDSLEGASDKFREAALMVGGIKPLTAFFEAATSSGLITKMMKAADGKKISGGFETTLGELGFTGKLRDDIFAQIRKHAITKDSKVFGKSLKKINIEAWDPAVRDAFIIGVKRHTNTIVQRSTMGDKVGVVLGDKLIQNTITGKLGLEMKGYVINSWSKQLGRALTRRDLYSLGMFTTQMTFGALAYMAQVHTNYPHDAKKRKELLDPENIAKATFARSSMASWLPQIIDSGAATGLYDKQFAHARSSGLGSELVGGMPVVDLLNTASSLVKVPGAVLGANEGLDPSEVKSAMRALPLHNMLGARALMEGIVSNTRDERSLERQRGY